MMYPDRRIANAVSLVAGLAVAIIGLVNVMPAYPGLPRLGPFPVEWFRPLFFWLSTLAASAALLAQGRSGRIPAWLDAALLALAVAAMGYACWDYWQIGLVLKSSVMFFSQREAWISTLAAAAALYLCWRVWGGAIALLGAVAFAYLATGSDWPGFARAIGGARVTGINGAAEQVRAARGALGLTGARLASAPVDNEMAVYYRHMERFSAALAFSADVAMGTLGGALKLKESTSARLGDVLSHLYMASATLKGFEVNGGTEEDKVHATWALEYHLHEIENALHEFVRNYPIKAVRPLLKLVALPRGRKFNGPTDRMNSALCDMMLGMKLDSAFGQRMTYDIYIGKGENDPTGRLMEAYKKLQEVDSFYSEFLRAAKHGEIEGESVEEQLKSALERRILTAEQVDAIREYDRLRYDVLLTDDFSKEYLLNPLSDDARKAEGRPVDLRKAS